MFYCSALNTFFYNGLNKHRTVVRCSLKVVSTAVCNILKLRHKYGKNIS
jgi:hypothetical protein